MRLVISNIGKIKECDILVNGITVVAGVNNSGKSTIGKTLYSVFHTFFNTSASIFSQRRNNISHIMWEFGNYPYDVDDARTSDLIKRLTGESIETIEEYLRENKTVEMGGLSENVKVDYQELAKKIYEALSVSDDELLRMIFKRIIVAELGSSIGNVNFPGQESKVSLFIKEKEAIKIEICDGIKKFLYTNFYKDIVYIDDPFVLDWLHNPRLQIFAGDGHKKELVKKLTMDDNPDLIDEYITTKKLNNIYKKLSIVCDGGVIKEQGRWIYHSEHLKKNLEINSLSSGMKNFLILKMLLEKGAITSNGIIILDEPEINLHPEWQLVLAEILVLLHKEFNLNILLNTHSPYFLNAVETYSKKYDVVRACNYYLSKNLNDYVAIEDVTFNIERIYSVLAAPLQKLEGEANG